MIATAPVRISFAGGGTDLAAYYERFGGFVVSAAITRYSTVTALPPADGGISIHSEDFGVGQRYPRGKIPSVAEPLSLPCAAIEWFADSGLRRRGVDLVMASEVPPGTGLGSSSAMAVALVRALAGYVGQELDAGEVAEIASHLEIGRLAMPIGKQDQYASAFAGLNAIEFHAGSVEVRTLVMRARIRELLASRLLLFSTGKSRNSGDILRQQRAATLTDPTVIRSLHCLKALAQDLCTTLEGEDLDGFGDLLHAAWQQKKRLSRRISSDSIDRWYDIARDAGAGGGKITGAGGGGYLLLYCREEHQNALRHAMAGCGLEELTFGFAGTGARDTRKASVSYA